ncbi:hypothetical protein AVEN_184248-1 [Araneus ventricosus]|uniref:Uncharacterized protein n=1 Tax=Araneus ventricosus TaxID=182803 RepID=A0A4Y2P8I5_ARAVE|nr:hypothetical protein AVEN_184248-1 [Araneus ventricosus]
MMVIKDNGMSAGMRRSSEDRFTDLAPSDFHLFLKLKEFLGSKRFGSDEGLENVMATCHNELAAEEYDMGILKLADIYDKCLNVGGDYVEK